MIVYSYWIYTINCGSDPPDSLEAILTAVVPVVVNARLYTPSPEINFVTSKSTHVRAEIPISEVIKPPNAGLSLFVSQ